MESAIVVPFLFKSPFSIVPIAVLKLPLPTPYSSNRPFPRVSETELACATNDSGLDNSSPRSPDSFRPSLPIAISDADVRANNWPDKESAALVLSPDKVKSSKGELPMASAIDVPFLFKRPVSIVPIDSLMLPFYISFSSNCPLPRVSVTKFA